MLRPFPDSYQGHQMPKIHHPDIGGEPSQATWNEIQDRDRRQRTSPCITLYHP